MPHLSPMPALKPLALALSLALSLSPGLALAGPGQAVDNEETLRLLKKLTERVERLEARNAELEKQLQAKADTAPGVAHGAIEQRVSQLEAGQKQVDLALENDRISEKEPELASRLKALEAQSVSAQAAAHRVEALDGISAGVSLTTVAQKPLGKQPPGSANSQLNYRGDAFVQLPLGHVGNAEQKMFVQFRLGQGDTVHGSAASFANPNASAFQAGSGLRSDDTVATLAQAWYLASIPLPLGGYKPHAKEKLEISFGKIDPFVFFDQNAVAGDETRQFLNSIFVHNPLLDAGGDIGTDANGFSPGLRLEYSNETHKPQSWRVSLGLFGTGPLGANYQRTLAQPLVLLQAETEQRLFGGLPGAYRLYAWRNPQAAHFDSSISTPEHHTGWGISANQRVGDGVTLFTRYGHQVQGHVAFDRALTLGAEWNGSYWSRGGDSLGLAAGYLRSSQAYRAGLINAGNERVAEVYYRFRINKAFELSPNWQFIDNPSGERAADKLRIIGLRAQVTY